MRLRLPRAVVALCVAAGPHRFGRYEGPWVTLRQMLRQRYSFSNDNADLDGAKTALCWP